ncbi:MAG: RNA polymerase sigma factor [Kiritimatiellae bacterium]|nr:RNA polymerase sigma factor [Kiritimatiellia bacterium]
MKKDRLEAFENLVSEYEAPLLRYAARLVRDRNAAEDIVQEAFIRLFRGWSKELKAGQDIANWLYRVTHNCAVDYIRKRSRRHLLHIRHAMEKEVAGLDGGAGTTNGDVSDLAARAAAALGSLSLREQQLVILKVYEGKSYREISEITGLSVSNIGYILHHAMKKLAAELGKGQRHHE